MSGLAVLLALATLCLAVGPRLVDEVAAFWQSLLLAGCNDDFASRASNLAELLRHEPDLIFIQEGKAADYRELRDDAGRRLLPRHVWGVHQDTSSPDRAGSVVIWRFAAFGRTAGGFTLAGIFAGLLPRWIAWLRGRAAGRRLFVFSAHRPPLRDRAFWRPFDRVLWARLRLARAVGRIVIGQIDSNEHGGPPIPAGFAWYAVGDSIDGFILSDSEDLEVISGPIELPKGSSDHHPLLMLVRIRLTRRLRRRASAGAGE